MDQTPTVLVRVRVDRPAAGASATDAVELAAAALWAEGATAVEVRDDGEGTTLLAGYPTASAAEAVAAHLGPSLGAVCEAVTDSSWRDAWRDWVHPVAVGDALLVVPAWQPVPVGAGRVVLEIDSGPCFGSGTHPTTRMVLQWLDGHPPAGLDVLDVGTGSGILAVAAARLGARSVTAVDVDPAAVAVTQANSARNGVEALVAVSTTPVGDVAAGAADVVLVNVTAGVHATIGAACARAVRPGGALVLSGLLPGQWRHVAGVYGALDPAAGLELDGWEGAVLRRSG